MLEKKEMKYIAFAGLFAFVYFVYLLPIFQSKFAESNPIVQFLIFNIGLLVVFQLILKGLSGGNGSKVQQSIGLLLLHISLSIFSPPYLISKTGVFASGPLFASASDYFAGFIGQSIGVPSNLLFYFTYLVFPVALLFLASFLLKDFVRRI